ncbi:MAG: hypothetical protein QXO69_01590 [archaeon]
MKSILKNRIDEKDSVEYEELVQKESPEVSAFRPHFFSRFSRMFG